MKCNNSCIFYTFSNRLPVSWFEPSNLGMRVDHFTTEHVQRPRNVWRLVVMSILCIWLMLVASNFENKSLKEPSEIEVNIIRKLDSFVSANRFVGVYKMQPPTQQCLRILKNKPLFVIATLCRWVVRAHYIIRLKNVLEGIQTS